MTHEGKQIMTDFALEDPIGVINSLQIRVQNLERELALERQRCVESNVIYMANCLKYLRLHGVISMHVGAQEFSATRDAILSRDPQLSPVMDQVWELSRAPLDDSVKSAIATATDHGNTRW